MSFGCLPQAENVETQIILQPSPSLPQFNGARFPTKTSKSWGQDLSSTMVGRWCDLIGVVEGGWYMVGGWKRSVVTIITM